MGNKNISQNSKHNVINFNIKNYLVSSFFDLV